MRQADADVSEAHVSVAFEGTSWTDPEAYSLMVIQSMLGTWDRLSGAGAKVIFKKKTGDGRCSGGRAVRARAESRVARRERETPSRALRAGADAP